MKKTKISNYTSLESTETYEGETIEEKIRRIMLSGEPITDGAPIIYTEKKDGVRPEYDIRTDKWDVALGALDLLDKTEAAKGIIHPATKEAEQSNQGT